MCNCVIKMMLPASLETFLICMLSIHMKVHRDEIIKDVLDHRNFYGEQVRACIILFTIPEELKEQRANTLSS